MSETSVTLRGCHTTFGKPPAVNYQLDLTFRNDAEAPRWFLLSTQPGAALTTNLTAVESFIFRDPPVGAYLEIYGDPAGVLAFLISGHSEVQLDKVPVTSFDSVSQVDVWTASAVRVGNQKLLEDCIDLPLALTNNLSIEAANDTYVGPGYEHSGEGPNTLSMDTPTHLTLPLPTE